MLQNRTSWLISILFIFYDDYWFRGCSLLPIISSFPTSTSPPDTPGEASIEPHSVVKSLSSASSSSECRVSIYGFNPIRNFLPSILQSTNCLPRSMLHWKHSSSVSPISISTETSLYARACILVVAISNETRLDWKTTTRFECSPLLTLMVLFVSFASNLSSFNIRSEKRFWIAPLSGSAITSVP